VTPLFTHTRTVRKYDTHMQQGSSVLFVNIRANGYLVQLSGGSDEVVILDLSCFTNMDDPWDTPCPEGDRVFINVHGKDLYWGFGEIRKHVEAWALHCNEKYDEQLKASTAVRGAVIGDHKL